MNLATGIVTTVAAEQILETAVLQTVAHELRQPLSAIESIAYYLSMILPRGDPAHEQAVLLRKLVEQANWIVSSGEQLAEQAAAVPAPMDLEELITETVAARSTLGETQPELDLAGNLPPVLLDPGRARALIENLLILFLQLARESHPVQVRTWVDGSVQIELATSATGYVSESALGPGSTLSLESARKILRDHEGCLGLSVDPAKGIRLRVVLQPDQG